ncbi:MAG: DNA polymerase III subunit alpha [Helicobacteraceae bacterium]|jgi:DNA polymerase-3 subunit alpha|nr:DNA polymerase III subunit alpha [Helicobacteraceae bacterium]
MSFVHLHLHTEYSMLDGANRIAPLAEVIKKRGMDSAAITDHGNMFGAIDFYKTMKKNGIKPIIGIEAYIHNNENLECKDPHYHLCLFAKNNEGYKNLMRLSSESYLGGFYGKPRINKRLLEEYHDGLICSSACLAGEVNFHLNVTDAKHREYRKGYEAAKEIATWYKALFGDDFYLELMRCGVEQQLAIDSFILRLSKELDIKVIATNDAHYLSRVNAEAQELAMCIGSGKKLSDPKRLKHSVKEFFVKSPEEMSLLFADVPEALANTLEIRDKCNLDLKLGDPTPPNYKFTRQIASQFGVEMKDDADPHENDAVLFERLCRDKLSERLKFIAADNHQLYIDRLETEVSVIRQMKFCGYMLIVWDFVNKAKEMKIPVGPGRGSAAGSLVAFALEITDIDPIKYGLLFERFLNPERVSMPDIDMDFCQSRRGEIIDYVVNAYGRHNVAQVITYNSLLARGVIRDVARVLDVPIPEADRLAKLIPEGLDDEGNRITLNQALELEPKLKEMIETDENAKRIWKFAIELEGLKRQPGRHAAGVVISNEPLWHKTPLCFVKERDEVITQYDGHYLEDVNLIKFDFLGLQTLTVINRALDLIEKRTGERINFSAIGTDKVEVYEQISTGNTLGIFQIESGGLQSLSRRLKPSCFEDLIAMIALYRPGPLESGMVDDFVERKHGRAKTTYAFASLEPILAPTYGVIVYQEQVMQIVQAIGGFSLGKADLVRRAMGKKNKEEMERVRSEFVQGALANGYDRAKAADLFDLIEKFAGYGFNKSHSAAYAMLTYQTAYLKCLYPAEFMSALLTFESIKKVPTYIEEIKRMGIEFLPPSVNLSQIDFEPVYQENETPKIIFGLGAIKSTGSVALEGILKIRDELGGKFGSLGELLGKIDSQKVNKKVFEALIKAGALDCFGYTRMSLLSGIDAIVQSAQEAVKVRKLLSGGLFESDAKSLSEDVNLFLPEMEELQPKELLEFEKESMGLYVSGHPLDDFRKQLEEIKYTLSSEVEELRDGGEAMVVGKVESLDAKISKKGIRYGDLRVIDLVGSVELRIFDRQMEKLEKLDSNMPIAFIASVDKTERGVSLIVRDVMSVEKAKEYKGAKNYGKSAEKKPADPIRLCVNADANPNVLNELLQMIRVCPGDRRVHLLIRSKTQSALIDTKMSAGEQLLNKAHALDLVIA